MCTEQGGCEGAESKKLGGKKQEMRLEQMKKGPV